MIENALSKPFRAIPVQSITIGANESTPIWMRKISYSIYGNYILPFAGMLLVNWANVMGLVLDNEIVCLASVGHLLVLGGFMLPLIDVKQWRIVAGSIRNLYVLVACIFAVALTLTLTGSNALSQAVVCISLSASGSFVPVMEVLDVPTLGIYCFGPPVMFFFFFVVLKFNMTGVFMFTGLVDVHYEVIGGIKFSILSILNSVMTITLFLILSKLYLLWKLLHGDTLTLYGKQFVNVRISVKKSHQKLDNLLGTKLCIPLLISAHAVFSIVVIVMFVRSLYM
jgi:hypothetical protein